MNSTGRKSEKSGYLVILLLVVGLTAFSHSMKELTEIHQLTLDASRLVAQWSGNFTPAEIPQVPQTIVKIEKIEKHETCESRQPAPAAELLTEPSAVAPDRTQRSKNPRVERRVITIPSEAEIAKKLHRIDINADAFEVRVPAVQLPDSDEQVTTEFPAFTFKTKTRKPGAIKFKPPREHEMILKTLNRSINLRIAS
jgi:hypothetical protein